MKLCVAIYFYIYNCVFNDISCHSSTLVPYWQK